jgi:hypothetical protein
LPAKSGVAGGTFKTARSESGPRRVTRALHPYFVAPAGDHIDLISIFLFFKFQNFILKNEKKYGPDEASAAASLDTSNVRDSSSADPAIRSVLWYQKM